MGCLVGRGCSVTAIGSSPRPPVASRRDSRRGHDRGSSRAAAACGCRRDSVASPRGGYGDGQVRYLDH